MDTPDYGPGIDYGRLTGANRDEHGIHYGIIPAMALPAWVYDSLEAIYTPRCGWCGEDAPEDATDAAIYTCPGCGKQFPGEDLYGDEPDYWQLEEDGVVLESAADGDYWVFSSPFAIRAQFCSPCAPGAGHLSYPHPDGPLTYCLPPDWYADDDQPCPYPIEDVITLPTR